MSIAANGATVAGGAVVTGGITYGGATSITGSVSVSSSAGASGANVLTAATSGTTTNALFGKLTGGSQAIMRLTEGSNVLMQVLSNGDTYAPTLKVSAGGLTVAAGGLYVNSGGVTIAGSVSLAAGAMSVISTSASSDATVDVYQAGASPINANSPVIRGVVPGGAVGCNVILLRQGTTPLFRVRTLRFALIPVAILWLLSLL